jgi:transcriptional regulator with XRE-family HTH domain
MSSSILRDRLSLVVNVVFGGNAFSASQAAGLQASTMHRILEGKVAEPRLSTIRRIADAYGLPLPWLLGEMTEGQARLATAAADLTDFWPQPQNAWLVYAYHRTRQQPAREWLARAYSDAPSTQATIEQLRRFDFVPAAASFPVPAIRRILAEGDERTDADLAVTRMCAEMETAVLEYAVEKLKAVGVTCSADGRSGDTPRGQGGIG